MWKVLSFKQHIFWTWDLNRWTQVCTPKSPESRHWEEKSGWTRFYFWARLFAVISFICWYKSLVCLSTGIPETERNTEITECCHVIFVPTAVLAKKRKGKSAANGATIASTFWPRLVWPWASGTCGGSPMSATRMEAVPSSFPTSWGRQPLTHCPFFVGFVHLKKWELLNSSMAEYLKRWPFIFFFLLNWTFYKFSYIYVSERHLFLQFITSWDAAVLHGNGLGPVCRSEKNIFSPPKTSKKH